MPVAWVLVLTSFLFSVGVYGVLARRNAVLVLMSIELMLNAANINLVVFNLLLRSTAATAGAYIGQVFALFIITIAAAELGIGLAIVILIFRNRATVSIDDVSLMKW
jgi:NADH-quinone oxidoreductase subunit K